MRRIWGRSAGLFGLAFLTWLPAVGAQPAPRVPAVVDLHVDLAYQHNYRQRPFATGTGQYLAERLERSGLIGVVLPLYVPGDVSPTGPRLEDLEWSYARVFSSLSRTPPYRLPGCVGPADRVATWLSLEGAAPLAGHPELVARWLARGTRLVGLVHGEDNALATSSGMGPTRVAPTRGLSPAGRELVERVHALGGIIDVSHASDQSVTDVLELARRAGAVVVASHSNARAVYNHPRNLSDEHVRAIAATGGLVAVNFHSGYLGPRARAEVGDVVRHLRHFVRLVGPRHVAIGSDFEGGIRPPSGLEGVSGFVRLAQALVEAGLSSDDVQRVMAGNALELLCASPRPAVGP